MNLKDYIVDVPNYPKEGILFKDIIETNVTTNSKNNDILWAVCVGAYKDKNKADSIVEELKKKGYTSAYLIPR